MARTKKAAKPAKRRAKRGNATVTHVGSLAKAAKRADAHAASLTMRAARIGACDSDPAQTMLKRALLIEARDSRGSAARSRKLAEQIASGHVPAPAARRRKTTEKAAAGGGKRRAK